MQLPVTYNTTALAQCCPLVQSFIARTIANINNSLFLDNGDNLNISAHASMLSIEQMNSALDSAIKSFNKRISEQNFTLHRNDTLESVFYKFLQQACISRERTVNKQKARDKENSDGMANEAFLNYAAKRLEHLRETDRRYEHICALVTTPHYNFDVKEIIHRHIQQMGERCKELIMEKVYHGKTHPEILREYKEKYCLNSLDTVRHIYSNCLKKLRENIFKEGFTRDDF